MVKYFLEVYNWTTGELKLLRQEFITVEKAIAYAIEKAYEEFKVYDNDDVCHHHHHHHPNPPYAYN